MFAEQARLLLADRVELVILLGAGHRLAVPNHVKRGHRLNSSVFSTRGRMPTSAGGVFCTSPSPRRTRGKELPSERRRHTSVFSRLPQRNEARPSCHAVMARGRSKVL